MRALQVAAETIIILALVLAVFVTAASRPPVTAGSDPSSSPSSAPSGRTVSIDARSTPAVTVPPTDAEGRP